MFSIADSIDYVLKSRGHTMTTIPSMRKGQETTSTARMSRGDLRKMMSSGDQCQSGSTHTDKADQSRA